jgi:hypothetical protein
VRAVHGPADLTWTEAAAALSTATGVPDKARRITGDEQRAGLRDAGLGEVAVEGIVGMSIGKREGFTPEQPPLGADDDAGQPGGLGDHPPAASAVAARARFVRLPPMIALWTGAPYSQRPIQ